MQIRHYQKGEILILVTRDFESVDFTQGNRLEELDDLRLSGGIGKPSS